MSLLLRIELGFQSFCLYICLEKLKFGMSLTIMKMACLTGWLDGRIRQTLTENKLGDNDKFSLSRVMSGSPNTSDLSVH